MRLVESARNSDLHVQSYSGEQRSRVYIFSYMTGLRRAEMASLTPQSFDLEADPPILKVKARCSKHRKSDVLPLHTDLVLLLRQWLKGMKPSESLFPRLDRKKTWLMVKKDLERVGIPYETEEGIADFHAAGRHTHITGLLRNGAALTDARELARHGDIRMTMRYTHVGITERAQALAKLPALQMRCISRSADCQDMAASDTSQDGEDGSENDETPDEAGVSAADDAACQQSAAWSQSGGGGNRTRVPRLVRESLYVRSRCFVFDAAWLPSTGSQPRGSGTVFNLGRTRRDPGRFGFGDQLLGLSDENPQPGSPLVRRPEPSLSRQLVFSNQLLTWPADQPRHATRTSAARSNPIRPRTTSLDHRRGRRDTLLDLLQDLSACRALDPCRHCSSPGTN